MQTCSGEPISPEELKRREEERRARKQRKQEERMRKLEQRKRLGKSKSTDSFSQNDNMSDGNNSESEIDVVGEEIPLSAGDHKRDSMSPHSSEHLSYAEDSNDNSLEKQNDNANKVPLRSAFSIDSLLETQKVPRGRRPNSKYPRVQASKSMNPLSLGMYPLYPITQPVGFQVEKAAFSSVGDDTKHLGCSEALQRFSSPSSLKSYDYRISSTSPQTSPYKDHHPLFKSQHTEAGDHPSDGEITSNHQSVRKEPETDQSPNQNCTKDDKEDREIKAASMNIVLGRKCLTPPYYIPKLPQHTPAKRPHSNPIFISSDKRNECLSGMNGHYALDCTDKGKSPELSSPLPLYPLDKKF